MISNKVENVTCPKCDSTKDIIKFDRDIYIIRDNGDFVRRKLYGCQKCENMFTYDSTPRKETKNMGIQSIFAKIAKQCENVTKNVSIKT
jgi:hypothetical protein